MMKVQFEGWARNHGSKSMLAKTLRSDQILDNPFPLKQGELTAKVLRPDEDLADGIRLYFSTNIRLGGDQLGTITISTKELMRMVRACTRDKTLEQVIALFNDAPVASKNPSLKLVQ